MLQEILKNRTMNDLRELSMKNKDENNDLRRLFEPEEEHDEIQQSESEDSDIGEELSDEYLRYVTFLFISFSKRKGTIRFFKGIIK